MFHKAVVSCAALAVGALLAACAGPGAAAPGTTVAPADPAAGSSPTGEVDLNEHVPAATLGAGDVFEVRVYEEPGLSGPFRVGSDGTIDYPLCGPLRVQGLSPAGLSALIESCLQDGYLREPHATVFVREHNSKKIHVFGDVEKAGTFAFEENMTVVEAVTRAGGFKKTAAQNAVIISRLIDGQERRLKVPVQDIGLGRAPNLLLQPGDIVYVPESFF